METILFALLVVLLLVALSLRTRARREAAFLQRRLDAIARQTMH